MANNCGYEYMNSKSIQNDLKCFICSKPFINPVKTNCSSKPHTFCNHCINERIKSFPECPTCRQNIDNKQTIILPDEDIQVKLDELLVKCNRCCKKDIKRGEFSKHDNEICIKAPVSCPAAQFGCLWTGIRADLEKHTNTCAISQLRPWCIETINRIETQQIEINALNETVRQLQICKDTLEDENKRMNDQIKDQQKKINDIIKIQKNDFKKYEHQIKELNDMIVSQSLLIQDLTYNENHDKHLLNINKSFDEDDHRSQINPTFLSNNDQILTLISSLASISTALIEDKKPEVQTTSSSINNERGVNRVAGINNAPDINNCHGINNVENVNNRTQINNKINANNSLSINNNENVRNVYTSEYVNNDNNDRNTNIDAHSVADNERRVSTTIS